MRWSRRTGVAVEKALAYPEDSAGRLMQREVVHAPETLEPWARSIEELPARQTSATCNTEQFYHFILTHPRLKAHGELNVTRGAEC